MIKDKWHRTPLHWAARWNNDVMVTCLLDLGMGLYKKDGEGKTAKEIAKIFKATEALNAVIVKEDIYKEITEKVSDDLKPGISKRLKQIKPSLKKQRYIN
jgi:ankyrin repeat protein